MKFDLKEEMERMKEEIIKNDIVEIRIVGKERMGMSTTGIKIGQLLNSHKLSKTKMVVRE